MSVAPLIQHNVAYLEQALQLLLDTDENAYTETRAPYFTSGIGDHLRHIIEHYQCFLAGLSSGSIDYDGRQRDKAISSSPEHASDTIRGLIDELSEIPESDTPVRVRLDGSGHGSDADPWSSSTVKREMQYLQAHTVHHYALIAFILRLQGSEPSAEFGVAPSTLRFRGPAAAANSA